MALPAISLLYDCLVNANKASCQNPRNDLRFYPNPSYFGGNMTPMGNHEEILEPVRRAYAIDETLTQVREERQVIVHCQLEDAEPGMLVRIWQSTYLIDSHTGNRSALLHAENISTAPVWTRVSGNQFNFTLVFAALPQACVLFDLREMISEPGGFEVKHILRNNSDVYRVML